MNHFEIRSNLLENQIKITSDDKNTTDFVLNHEIAFHDANEAGSANIFTLHVTDDLGAEYCLPLSQVAIVKLAN